MDGRIFPNFFGFFDRRALKQFGIAILLSGKELQFAFSLRVILGPFYRDIPLPSILSIQLLEVFS
jgi:hypothetical protein